MTRDERHAALVVATTAIAVAAGYLLGWWLL